LPAAAALRPARQKDAREVFMRGPRSSLLLVLATLLSGSPALAQSEGTFGTTTIGRTAIDLTPEQKSTIARAVTKQNVTRPPPQHVPATVGAELPASVELYTLPVEVMLEVPQAKLYKYTMINDNVVIVDPTNMKVVEVIER
jgi:hypothetical protein